MIMGDEGGEMEIRSTTVMSGYKLPVYTELDPTQAK